MQWAKVAVCLAILVMAGAAIYVQPHAQAWWDKHFPTENEDD